MALTLPVAEDRNMVSSRFAVRVSGAVIIGYAGLAAAALMLALRGPSDWEDVANSVLAVCFVAVPAIGAVALRTDAANRMGWAFLAAGFGLSLNTFALVYGDVAINHSVRLPAPNYVIWLDPLGTDFYLLGVVFGVLLLPDGRLPDRRRRWRFAAWVAGIATGLQVSNLVAADFWHFDVKNPFGLRGLAGQVGDNVMVIAIIMLPLVYTITAGVMTARLRTAMDRDLEAALRWTTLGAWLIATSQWICFGFGGTAWQQMIYVLEHSSVICLALGAWVGVLRYRLFDVRFIVNRALLYSALTVVVILTYIGVVAAIRVIAEGYVSTLAAVLVAALVALPLRDGLQRQANRLVYGHRQDPYAAFELLAEQLGAAVTPGAALPRVVANIATTLRLSYVAVRADDRILAVAGTEGTGRSFDVLLQFEGEKLGSLVVRTADVRDRLSPAEQRLIEGLAPQVAAALRAILLGEALQQSRQRIEVLREDERRRIRRDLHDGLGPTLAGIVLGLDRAREQLERDVAVAAATLDALCQHASSAVTDVRRLVHQLQPPALDQLGLAGALREEGRRFGSVHVDADHNVQGLTTEVEVALYRIAMEAMTNATRHGRADSIRLRIRLDDNVVELQVADNGVGLSDNYRSGIGIDSMQQRARELGGRCTVESTQPSGTTVRATLPLPVLSQT